MPEFKEVAPQDFLTFTRESPSHVLIENHIINMGGGGKQGIEYKIEVLKEAGWKYGDLTSYGSHADVAACAFNNVRQELTKTTDAATLLANVSKH